MTKITSEGLIGVGIVGESVIDIMGKRYEANFLCSEYYPVHMVSMQISAGHIKTKTTNGLLEVDNSKQLIQHMKITHNGLK